MRRAEYGFRGTEQGRYQSGESPAQEEGAAEGPELHILTQLLSASDPSQYFLWYLPFLPPLLPSLSPSSLQQSYLLLGVWLLTQVLWLSQAYLLEMRAQDVFLRIWAAGLVYVVGMAWVLLGVVDAWDRGRREMLREGEEEVRKEEEQEERERKRSVKENGASAGGEMAIEAKRGEVKAEEVPIPRRGNAQPQQQGQQSQQQGDVKPPLVAGEVK